MAVKSRALDIFVEISPAETRAALVDRDGVLRGFAVERMGEESLIGSIHLGRVSAIEGAAQLAFLDIGRADPVLVNRPPAGLTQGAKVIVQITRDGRGHKGPAGTLLPALEGVGQAYCPGRAGLDWPRSFGKGKARAEMEEKVNRIFFDGIDGMRPLMAGLELTDKAFQAEAEALRARWQEIEARAAAMDRPGVLVSAPDLVDRLMREAGPEDRIALDDRIAYRALEDRCARELSAWRGRIAFHPGPEPIFTLDDIADQLEQALTRVVPLAGGGRLVIDRTEALTVIDVDLGDGLADGDDAILRVNRRAAQEAARHILLRNLSGLIVIDFLRMKAKGRLGQVLDALKSGLKNSRTPVDVLGMSPGGLVEITRQRAGASLDELVLEAPQARGPAAGAVAADLLRRALRLTGAGRPVLTAPQPVLALLRDGVMAPARLETEKRLALPITMLEGPVPEVRLEKAR